MRCKVLFRAEQVEAEIESLEIRRYTYLRAL